MATRWSPTPTPGAGKKDYLDFSECESVEQFFAQFRYEPKKVIPIIASNSPAYSNPTPIPTGKPPSKAGKKEKKQKCNRKGEKKEAKKKSNNEAKIKAEHLKEREKQDKKKSVKEAEIIKLEDLKEQEQVTSNKNKRRRNTNKSVCLTTEQRWSQPYRRVPVDHHNQWVPPSSPHQLLQEQYYHDPWKVLVICILCNRTRGSQTAKIIHDFFSSFPSAEATIDIPAEVIEDKIRHLGLHKKRSLAIKRLSMEYLQNWEYVTQLHAVGKYAADAYAIFCSGRWRDVTPIDHKLVDYWKFLHDAEKVRTTIVDCGQNAERCA